MTPTIGQAFYFSGAKIRTYLNSSKFFKQIFQYLSKFFLSLPGILFDINILEPEKSRAVSSVLFPDHIGRQSAGLVGEEAVEGVDRGVAEVGGDGLHGKLGVGEELSDGAEAVLV